jgi:hypothetical protein
MQGGGPDLTSLFARMRDGDAEAGDAAMRAVSAEPHRPARAWLKTRLQARPLL